MKREAIRILCVDDEKNVLRAVARAFLDEDYEILSAQSGEEGLLILDHEAGIQIVLSDYRMPGMNGVEFLREVCRRHPETIRIVLSGYANTAAVVDAINEGEIYKFIPKPWDDEDLKSTIQNGLERYFRRQQDALLVAELRKAKELLEAEVMIRSAQLKAHGHPLAGRAPAADPSPGPGARMEICTDVNALCGLGCVERSDSCWKSELPAAIRLLQRSLGGHCRVFHTIAAMDQDLRVSSVQVNSTAREGFLLINFEKRG